MRHDFADCFPVLLKKQNNGNITAQTLRKSKRPKNQAQQETPACRYRYIDNNSGNLRGRIVGFNRIVWKNQN